MGLRLRRNADRRGCWDGTVPAQGARGQGTLRAGPGRHGSGAHPNRAGLASMEMVWVKGQEHPLSGVQGQKSPCRCAEAAPLPCSLRSNV
jgi:hypothetical protein